MSKTTTLTAAVLAALTPPALADITSVSGSVTHIAPPSSVTATSLAVDGHAFVFQEQDNLFFDGPVDRVSPVIGFHYQVTHALNTSYTGVVDSHMIHFDNTALGTTTPATGRVHFDGTIVALIFTNTKLDLTDAALGAPGTTYPLGLANRGFSSTDFIRLEGPGTVYFSLVNGGAMDQVRVLTVPAPAGGALGLAAFATLGVRRRRA